MPKKSGDENVVVKAKSAGKAAAKVAALAGADPQTQSADKPASAPPAPARSRGVMVGRLQKKNNPHLPRRLKKAQQKRAEKELRSAA